MNEQEMKKLKLSLLLLRLGVFLVMFVWTLDKFINPGHTAKVFSHFYMISDLGNIQSYIVGSIQLIIILFFLGGVCKRWSYLAVMILHGISTFSTYANYLNPYDKMNLLFFAAWPMLAACVALYWLRDQDTLGNLPICKAKS